MNTSTFLATLRSNSSLPLVFRTPEKTVAPGYHLTEVKRVAYETMDCGAVSHRWPESQFEIWVPSLAEGNAARGHMLAEKFLRIIDRVEVELPLNGDATARIHASLDGKPAALYDIVAVKPREGELTVELTPDRTRCKAAERRSASLTDVCCGVGSEERETEEAAIACGCGSSDAAATASARCA